MARYTTQRLAELRESRHEYLYEEMKQNALDIAEIKLELADLEYNQVMLAVINGDKLKQAAEDISRLA